MTDSYQPTEPFKLSGFGSDHSELILVETYTSLWGLSDIKNILFPFREMQGLDVEKPSEKVAVTGEVGFEKVIGLGMYALEQGTVAEVAFSTSKQWQGRGIAGVLLDKLAEAARENGITRLVAYMLATNTGMIKLFNKLPYKVDTKYEDGTLVLSCNFEKIS